MHSKETRDSFVDRFLLLFQSPNDFAEGEKDLKKMIKTSLKFSQKKRVRVFTMKKSIPNMRDVIWIFKKVGDGKKLCVLFENVFNGIRILYFVCHLIQNMRRNLPWRPKGIEIMTFKESAFRCNLEMNIQNHQLKEEKDRKRMRETYTIEKEYP